MQRIDWSKKELAILLAARSIAAAKASLPLRSIKAIKVKNSRMGYASFHRRISTAEKFLLRVKKSATCWIWTGPEFQDSGYGDAELDGKRMSAHRMSYELFVGQIPSGKSVLHECDVRLCVKPEHLFTGTRKDNIDDMVIKGRQASGDRHKSRTKPWTVARGARHGMSKLTDRDVAAIKQMLSEGHTHLSIAGLFGVHKSSITLINIGKTWMHVERSQGGSK